MGGVSVGGATIVGMTKDPAGEVENATWITKAEAASIVPGLTPAHLDRMRLDPFYRRDRTPPPARVLSDRQVIYDELQFRRWLEGTVSHDWVWGRANSRRGVTDDRRYVYQDADLEQLRRRTYVNEAQLREIVPQIPLWRLRDLRFRGVGPRFLKPSAKLVVYIEQEARDWVENVGDYFDPERDDENGQRQPPYTPAPTP